MYSFVHSSIIIVIALNLQIYCEEMTVVYIMVRKES